MTKNKGKTINRKSEKFTYRFAQLLARRPVFKIFGIALLGMVLVAGTVGVTGFGQKTYRLGGSWVGGNSLYTWSCLFAPSDPAGQSAAARPILSYFNGQFAGLLSSFGADSLSVATGEIKMVSLDTGRWTLISYMQVTPKAPGEQLQNKAIIVSHGTWKYTSDVTATLNYTLDIYPPSADADGDGYPDDGAQPLLSIPTQDTGKRVPIL